ncbi:roundabout homolog 3-like [Syngnathus acus]|uniref:roundabout homolog 3-like n=1 Tax=Syngnathus acus TaxID=161584 RepID=UPI001885E429|nr:roundabout homolog 3-like [Syngnathus acus]XP_037118436.1 roundabout homolog 3-like [Syngnathus acus]XP_037118437.1 roundabout homolog 3-like [Syngnathus acus]
MRIFSMRVALVLLLLSPWRPVKPEAGTSCTCVKDRACSCNVGQSVTLESTPLTANQVAWKKNGNDVTATDGKVTVQSLTSTDAGMYVAIEGTDVTKTMAYLVQVYDPVTTVSVERVAAKQVSLSCIASGPFKGLKWKKDDTAITAGQDYKLGLNNAQLIIKDGSANPGKYTCVAVQFDGSEKVSDASQLE